MSNVKIVIITVLNLYLTENIRRVVLCRQVVALYCQGRTISEVQRLEKMRSLSVIKQVMRVVNQCAVSVLM
jgi:hypothetical protein